MSELKETATQAILAVYAENDQLRARNAELEALQGPQELWCVHVQWPDDLLAMRSRVAAEKCAADINALGIEGVSAEVVPSQWPLDIHTTNAFAVLEQWLEESNAAMALMTAQLGKMRHLLSLHKSRAAEEIGKVAQGGT